MGKKDISQSNFFDNKERFADFFNGILFDGRQVIHASELEDTDSVMVLGREEHSHKIIADKVRKWHGSYISILIQENQSYIDYGMVIRVMKEESACYDRQRKAGFAAYLAKGSKPDHHEYLSGMMKEQVFHPVITLVLYLGEEKSWDGKTQLHHLLLIPEELKPWVSNYKINLYDYHDHDDFSLFKTENRLLLELLSLSDHKEKLKRISENSEFHFSKDKEVAKAMLGILGIPYNVHKIYNNKSGGYDMRKGVKDWADELKAEGKQEGVILGRQEGVILGRQEGRQEGVESIIHILFQKGFPATEISSMLDLDDDYVANLTATENKN